MLSSRQSINLINKVHERLLSFNTNDQNHSFETLLQHDKEITVRQSNLQTLITELYKTVKGEAPAITKKPIHFSRKHS